MNKIISISSQLGNVLLGFSNTAGPSGVYKLPSKWTPFDLFALPE